MLRDQFNEAMKLAMKAGDKRRTGTLRLVVAAVKERDIANRTAGKAEASDDEIRQLLAKMIKQRQESASIYEANARPELAGAEREEIAIIESFLPAQMDEAAVEAALRAAVAETGAASLKDLGRVMAVLKERHAGQMDFGKASGRLKALLAGS